MLENLITWKGLKEIFSYITYRYFIHRQTKLDSPYPGAQLKIPCYQHPLSRKDRNKNGGGKVVFIKEGLITKRLNDFWRDISETLCLEVMILKKIWFITYVYWPTYSNNQQFFFSEISIIFGLAKRKYENILIVGDLNIDAFKIIVSIYPFFVIL